MKAGLFFFSCYVEFVIVILDAILFHDNITFSKKGKHVLVAFFLYFCTIHSRDFLVGNIQMDAMQ